MKNSFISSEPGTPERLPYCRHCDLVGYVGYRFCPLCGRQLKQRCQNCGIGLRVAETVYCKACTGKPGNRAARAAGHRHRGGG